MAVKVLRSGQLTLNIQIDSKYSRILDISSHSFDNVEYYNNEDSFKICFHKVPPIDNSAKTCPINHKDIILKYYKHLFKNYADNSDDIGSSFLTERMLKTSLFKSFLRLNKSSIISEYLIYDFRDLFFNIINLKNREGKVFYNDALEDNEISNLKSEISFLFFSLLPVVGSFALHCSAINRNNEGILFIGDGGSGKSTIAKTILMNVDDSKLLSDDMVAISEDQDGGIIASKLKQDNKELGITLDGSRTVSQMKVRKAYLINQAKTDSVRYNDRFESLKSILNKHLINPSLLNIHAESLTKQAIRFVDILEPKTLDFTKSNNFLKVI
jgi:hypothetical protein